MICEILHPIFDALNGEFQFYGLDYGGNYESVRRSDGRQAMLKICVALIKEKESAVSIANNLFVHIIVIDLSRKKWYIISKVPYRRFN